MDLLIAIIAFVIILVFLVIAHELGHFITAKARGVNVIEFGLGFPPRIWGIRRGETLYSINALPLGGFVKLAGEEDPGIPRSLASKGYGTRLLVLAAGSLMNIILPFILLSVAFMLPHDIYSAPIVIKEVLPGSQSERAGLRAGDTLISINDSPINNTADVQRLALLNLGNKIDLVVRHADAAQETIQLEPRWKPPAGQGATGLGIAYQASGNYNIASESLPFWEAVPAGAANLYDTLRLYKNEVVRWVIGSSAPQLSGVVGMTEVTAQVAKAGVSPLIEWAAFISINLGIINILPLPALDGGRIAFVLLEMVRRGRRVSPRVEGLVHSVGFFLLIVLMVVITYKDIFNIVTTGSAINP
jgi:regulator of sigma E protease